MINYYEKGKKKHAFFADGNLLGWSGAFGGTRKIYRILRENVTISNRTSQMNNRISENTKNMVNRNNLNHHMRRKDMPTVIDTNNIKATSFWSIPIKIKYIVIFMIILLLIRIFSTIMIKDIFDKEEKLPVVIIDYFGAGEENYSWGHFYQIGFGFKNGGDGLVRNLVITYVVEGYSSGGLGYKKIDTTIPTWNLNTWTILATGIDINVTAGIDYYLINVHCSWMHGSTEWNFFMDTEPNLRLEGEIKLT